MSSPGRFTSVQSCIMTYTGKMYWPMSPRHQDVSIVDIAHHIANQCRFSGAVQSNYNTAQHSWYVSVLCNPSYALQGLLHDAPEAYLLDMPRPLKYHTELGTLYKAAENKNWRVISEVFGVPFELHESVKEADTRMAETEARDLMHPLPVGFSERRHPDLCYPFKIDPWDHKKSEELFLERFHELTLRRSREYTT